jgi:stearoyl-CoA desaturase (Delta-9 desaturase)
MQNQSPKINKTVFGALVIYPLFIIGLALFYGYTYGLGLKELGFFLMAYYGATLSVGLGLHRLWAHGTYKTNKYVEFVLALFAAGTLQGPALVWSSDHHNHHAYTDKEKDPHTPLKFSNRIKGFFWSHMGWMLYSTNLKHLERVTLTKLGHNKILRWQMKYYWYLAVFMNLILPAAIGYLIGFDLQTTFAAYVFIGLGRALQQQMTFCVNSVCHFFGSKKYANVTSGDIGWMFIFLLGENWHNFHHAFGRDYRNGVKWYQFDVHKWLICAMEKVGLAYDLVRTPEVRIQAKIEETKRSMQETAKTRMSLIEEMASALAQAAKERLESAEASAEELRGKARKSLLSLYKSAEK